MCHFLCYYAERGDKREKNERFISKNGIQHSFKNSRSGCEFSLLVSLLSREVRFSDRDIKKIS